MEKPARTTGGASNRVRIEAVAVCSGSALLGGLGGLALQGLSESPLAACGFVALVAVGVGTWMNRRASQTARVLALIEQQANALQQGEPIRPIDATELGTLSGVGEALNTVFGHLGGIAHRVLGTIAEVQALPGRMTASMADIEASAEAQEEAVEETASLLMNINTSIGGINERVEKLSRVSEESSSSILEMGGSIDEVARNAASLHQSVESSTSSVHEMSASIRQVADSADEVLRMAQESAASMTEMDRTMQEVGNHVKEASSLSERVSEGAEQGTHAVTATIQDIERIHSLTSDAMRGLEQLVSRIGEIAGILNVIGDINDETNLLSLNAAIIAAQAGEQGKAFLVVANHVKVLAQRTATSTKDIERLIEAVKAESDSAVTAMEAGVEAIEQGVSRSRVAGQSLRAIQESARDSSQRVAEIARATEEQTRTSTLVAQAAQETSAQVQQITHAMSEQTKAGEQMLKASEDALEMCRHVHRSTDEQRATGRYITESISAITEMVRSISENTAAHARASGSVGEAVNRLLDNARKSGEQIPEMNTMLQELGLAADSIVTELAGFENAAGSFENAAEPTDQEPDSATDSPAL